MAHTVPVDQLQLCFNAVISKCMFERIRSNEFLTYKANIPTHEVFKSVISFIQSTCFYTIF